MTHASSTSWPTRTSHLSAARRGFRTLEPTSDTVCLLLHGVGGNRVSWTPLLTELILQRGRLPDLLIPDLPGFGESENRDLPPGSHGRSGTI